ncbi:hypothetical protein F8M41_008775 [Gigaspora margarita]|uniref:Uncharacterized protein n=1 Tax=Gigaspora margarita TaxID=4874 RepID=A0A8H4AVE9_GIGMA|nr:hypothetical protein F8M41_008775 [Gigaspora margarita]
MSSNSTLRRLISIRGRSTFDELAMMMKVERVANLYNEDSFDFAEDFGIVHVSIRNLIDENTCVREARALVTFIPIVLIIYRGYYVYT